MKFFQDIEQLAEALESQATRAQQHGDEELWSLYVEASKLCRQFPTVCFESPLVLQALKEADFHFGDPSMEQIRQMEREAEKQARRNKTPVRR